MTLTRDEVRDRLYAAYHALLRHDRALLELDANERSLTHKLAEYLQGEFPDWDVDCEYNRDGDTPKRLSVQTISTNDSTFRTDGNRLVSACLGLIHTKASSNVSSLSR